MATRAVAAWGLDPEGSLVWAGPVKVNSLPELLSQNHDLATRVAARLDRAYKDAIGLMAAHRPALEKIAAELLSRQTMTGEDVIAQIGRFSL